MNDMHTSIRLFRHESTLLPQSFAWKLSNLIFLLQVNIVHFILAHKVTYKLTMLVIEMSNLLHHKHFNRRNV